MNTKELSIGDYVMFQGETYMVEEILQKGDALHLMILETGTRLLLTTDYIGDFIEPVTLTEEILAKNNILWKHASSCYSEETSEYQIVIEVDEEDSGLFYVSTYGNGYSHECCGYVRSVHELQHIIRLAKIDKEIVL